MEQISISFDKDIKNIKKIANDYLSDEKIGMREENVENRFFLKFKIANNQNDKFTPHFYELISRIITEIIVLFYSKEIIGRKVCKTYTNYGRQERLAIIDIAYELFRDRDHFNKEKECIYDEVLDYIMGNKYIAVDGFVNFRLKKFKNNIDDLIEKSIDRFLAEKEYKEFIKILQYFVDIQEPKFYLVNVVISDDEHKLYDDNNKFIDSDFFNDVINDLVDEGINDDDLLLSSLIVIAPQKIIIHVEEKDKEKEIVKVIRSVFPDRVYFCSGCELCSVKKSIKKGE